MRQKGGIFGRNRYFIFHDDIICGVNRRVRIQGDDSGGGNTNGDGAGNISELFGEVFDNKSTVFSCLYEEDNLTCGERKDSYPACGGKSRWSECEMR